MSIEKPAMGILAPRKRKKIGLTVTPETWRMLGRLAFLKNVTQGEILDALILRSFQEIDSPDK